jgi:hypothetical protein
MRFKPFAPSSAENTVVTMTTPRPKSKTYDAPPPLGDRVSWKIIIATHAWARLRDSDLLEAWDAFRGIEKDIAESIEARISVRVLALLRKHLANTRYGRGHEIWSERENAVIIAMHMPQSRDGIAIRKSFVRFVEWSTVDAIRKDLSINSACVPYNDAVMTCGDPTDGIDAKIDLERSLERFAGGDMRKLNVIVQASMGFAQNEIRAKTGVSHVTQRRWNAAFELYMTERGSNRP